VRISVPVDPVLEITEVTDRISKGPADKNKALLFEHVNGSDKDPVFLFVASDEPTLKKLDLFKKWGRDKSDAVVRLD